MDALNTTELLKVARDKSVEGRETLAKVVSDLFTDDSSVLSERERTLTLDILHQLVHDFEDSVRKVIAENIADWPELPTGLAIFLANSEIEVAYPILTKSGVFKDESLIEVIRHRTMEHQLAIAIRQSVSAEVSSALVETGHQEVILKLLENKNASISEKTMEYLVDEAKRVDSFREPIIRRDELSQKLAQQMYLWVSAALRKAITEKYDLDENVIDDLLEKSAVQTFAKLNVAGIKQRKSDQLADELVEEGVVDAELLVQTLRGAEVGLFISLFTRMSGLREQLVKRILFEPGGEGLAIACKAIGISKSDFSDIFAFSRSAIPESAKDFSAEIRSVLKFFAAAQQESAETVLQRLKRDPNYLSALRDLELTS